jgi:uncharacterized membrane protein (DUF106 family)
MMPVSESPDRSIAYGRIANNGKEPMVSRILKKLDAMAVEHNSQSEFFKLQFNLGHLLTIAGILAVIVPMWINVIADDAQARLSLTETHAVLEDLKLHVNSIDKEVTMAVIDDDRLQRVQADVKEIQARIAEIQNRLK